MIDFDIIVIDAKLTIDTDFTPNQKTVKKFSTYTPRCETKFKIAGKEYTLDSDITVTRNIDFIKSFADENGVYKGLN
jgi:hypothetical protein